MTDTALRTVPLLDDPSHEAPRPGRLRHDRGFRRGMAGTLLIAAAAVSAGPLRLPDPSSGVPVLGWYRTSHAGHLLGTALFFAGMTALLIGWLSVGERADRTVRELWRIGAAWAAPLMIIPPLASRDVYSYLAQGKLSHTGLSPYMFGPFIDPGSLLPAVSNTWWYTPAPYGPAFLRIAGEVEQVTGGHLVLGVIVMRLLAIAGVVVMALLVRSLAVRLGTDPARATWLAVLNPLVLIHLVGGMHNEALLIPVVLAAVHLALMRRPLWAAAVLGIACAMKVTVLAALPFLAVLWVLQHQREHRGRFLLPAVAGVAAVSGAVLTFMSLVSGYGFGWVEAIGASTGRGSRLSLTSQLGWLLSSVGQTFGNDAVAADAPNVVRGLGMLVACWIVLRLLRAPVSEAHVLLRCGAALLVVAVMGPLVHPWYLLPGLALIAIVGPGPKATLLAVWTTLLTALLLRPEGGEVIDPRAPFSGLAALVALVVVVRWYRRRPVGVSAPVPAAP